MPILTSILPVGEIEMAEHIRLYGKTYEVQVNDNENTLDNQKYLSAVVNLYDHFDDEWIEEKDDDKALLIEYINTHRNTIEWSEKQA